MKRFTLWVAVMAAILGTGSLSAQQNETIKQSPMVLVELLASMKADMVMAEHMVRVDLRDELQALSAELVKETIETPVQFILERDVLEQDWSAAADE